MTIHNSSSGKQKKVAKTDIFKFIPIKYMNHCRAIAEQIRTTQPTGLPLLQPAGRGHPWRLIKFMECLICILLNIWVENYCEISTVFVCVIFPLCSVTQTPFFPFSFIRADKALSFYLVAPLGTRTKLAQSDVFFHTHKSGLCFTVSVMFAYATCFKRMWHIHCTAPFNFCHMIA